MALLFVGGMLVGNFYLPERNISVATSVSVPDLQCVNPILSTVNAQTARENLASLEQALNACPVIVPGEKEKLVKQINLLFALQDFYLKKTAFELEIAKNLENTKTSALYSKAASEYASAKRRTEQFVDELFPPAPKLAVPAGETATEVVILPTENTAKTKLADKMDEPKTQQPVSVAAKPEPTPEKPTISVPLPVASPVKPIEPLSTIPVASLPEVSSPKVAQPDAKPLVEPSKASVASINTPAAKPVAPILPAAVQEPVSVTANAPAAAQPAAPATVMTQAPATNAQATTSAVAVSVSTTPSVTVVPVSSTTTAALVPTNPADTKPVSPAAVSEADTIPSAQK